jgi:hypothetical protein
MAYHTHSPWTRRPESVLLKCIQDRLDDRQPQQLGRGNTEEGHFDNHCLSQNDISLGS